MASPLLSQQRDLFSTPPPSRGPTPHMPPRAPSVEFSHSRTVPLAPRRGDDAAAMQFRGELRRLASQNERLESRYATLMARVDRIEDSVDTGGTMSRAAASARAVFRNYKLLTRVMPLVLFFRRALLSRHARIHLLHNIRGIRAALLLFIAFSMKKISHGVSS
jgi:hypothetical protein